jgi:hypothetical protein
MRALLVPALLMLAACATDPSGSPEPAQAASPAVAAVPPPRAVRRPAAPSAWRVAEDGTTGCADRGALQRLREVTEPGAAGLRRLATLRAAGGCVTVFRTSAWRLVETGPEALRLELLPVKGARRTGALWFRRDQVVEERAAGA